MAVGGVTWRFLMALVVALNVVPCVRGDCGSQEDNDKFLALANEQRAAHGAGPQSWSPKLAAQAQAWVDGFGCNSGNVKHSDPSQIGDGTWYGENLWNWMGETFPRSDGTTACQAATNWFYSEVGVHNFATGREDPGTVSGHFTQVVWASSTSVGCGIATCPNKYYIVACQYTPPGNWNDRGLQEVFTTACQNATGDLGCASCSGATCTSCYKRWAKDAPNPTCDPNAKAPAGSGSSPPPPPPPDSTAAGSGSEGGSSEEGGDTLPALDSEGGEEGSGAGPATDGGEESGSSEGGDTLPALESEGGEEGSGAGPSANGGKEGGSTEGGDTPSDGEGDGDSDGSDSAGSDSAGSGGESGDGSSGGTSIGASAGPIDDPDRTFIGEAIPATFDEETAEACLSYKMKDSQTQLADDVCTNALTQPKGSACSAPCDGYWSSAPQECKDMMQALNPSKKTELDNLCALSSASTAEDGDSAVADSEASGSEGANAGDSEGSDSGASGDSAGGSDSSSGGDEGPV